MNVPAAHPIALLNSGLESNITYSPVSNSNNPIVINVSGGSLSTNSNGDYYSFSDTAGNALNIANGDFKFMVGKTYEFRNVNIASNHPLRIVISGTTYSMSYSAIKITIPPNLNSGSIYYLCGVHSSMRGNLSLLGRLVAGSTNDGTYNFYYGDVNVSVTGDFNNLSVYCFYHGYMGDENVFSYKST